MSREFQCGICGKKFLKVYCSIYHFSFAGKSYNFCSYTCYRQAQKIKEDPKVIEKRYVQFAHELNLGDIHENKS